MRMYIFVSVVLILHFNGLGQGNYPTILVYQSDAFEDKPYVVENRYRSSNGIEVDEIIIAETLKIGPLKDGAFTIAFSNANVFATSVSTNSIDQNACKMTELRVNFDNEDRTIYRGKIMKFGQFVTQYGDAVQKPIQARSKKDSKEGSEIPLPPNTTSIPAPPS